MITTLNYQNHISENFIGRVIYFFILTEVPFVYMERAGFMTCTAASHQGAIKEPAASLYRRHKVDTTGENGLRQLNINNINKQQISSQIIFMYIYFMFYVNHYV